MLQKLIQKKSSWPCSDLISGLCQLLHCNRHFSTWKPCPWLDKAPDLIDMGWGENQEGHRNSCPLQWVGEGHQLGSHRQRRLWEGVRKVTTWHPTYKGWKRRNQMCPSSLLATAQQRMGFSIPRSHYRCADGTFYLSHNGVQRNSCNTKRQSWNVLFRLENEREVYLQLQE